MIVLKEGNGQVEIGDIESTWGRLRVGLTRIKIRGNKDPEKVFLHFDKKKSKFTSWPKSWGPGMRASVQAWMVGYVENSSEAG